MYKRFQRTIEDFQCEHCGKQVTGDGYTNHCPKCFWSKHVDVHPGDRAQSCHGLMEPIALEGHDPVKITHRCIRCDFTRKNKVNPTDDFDSLIELSQQLSHRLLRG